jgi:hypothetical protein
LLALTVTALLVLEPFPVRFLAVKVADASAVVRLRVAPVTVTGVVGRGRLEIVGRDTLLDAALDVGDTLGAVVGVRTNDATVMLNDVIRGGVQGIGGFGLLPLPLQGDLLALNRTGLTLPPEGGRGCICI